MKRFLFAQVVILLGLINQAQASAWLGQRSFGRDASPLLTVSVSGVEEEEPRFGKWRRAHDYWGSQDKVSHFLFYGWLSRELADYFKSPWKGALSSFIVATVVNEGKDALVPCEQYGGAGGDGWSNWDILASSVGIGWSWWFGPEPAIVKGQYCSRPLSELWPKMATGGLWIGLWICGSAAYHLVDEGKFFPEGSGKWIAVSGDEGSFVHVLSNFNTEISFIGPWWVNANLRPYLPLKWRVVIIGASLFAFEHLNGVLRERDVPFLGDRGFRRGDMGVGFMSFGLVTLYEAMIFPKSAVCMPYSIAPTGNGLCLRFTW